MTRRVEKNLGLVYHIIYTTQCGDCFDHDERVSIGLEALTMAALNFRPELKYKFSTYACASIKRELIHKAHRLRNKKAWPFLTCDGELMHVAEDEDDAPDWEEREGRRREFWEAAEKLPERQLFVLRRAAAGDTLETIGAEIGRTKERARQIKNQALRKIRTRLERSGTTHAGR